MYEFFVYFESTNRSIIVDDMEAATWLDLFKKYSYLVAETYGLEFSYIPFLVTKYSSQSNREYTLNGVKDNLEFAFHYAGDTFRYPNGPHALKKHFQEFFEQTSFANFFTVKFRNSY